jgi:hypothetical protein
MWAGRGFLVGFVVGVTAAAGCAALSGAESGGGPGQYFTLRTAVSTETARLDGNRLFGPDVEVSRLTDGFRGHVGSRLVDLRTADMKVFGSIGSALTELYVERRPGGFVMKGMYGGKLGTIEMLADRMAGSIGNCTYDMIRADRETPRYTGRRACRGQVGTAEILFPQDLRSRPPEDQAALTALFLGQ